MIRCPLCREDFGSLDISNDVSNESLETFIKALCACCSKVSCNYRIVGFFQGTCILRTPDFQVLFSSKTQLRSYTIF